MRGNVRALAGRKVKGRKQHLIANADGTPVVMTVHTADIQGRDGAPELIAKLLATVPTVCRAVRRRRPPRTGTRKRLKRMKLPNVTGIMGKPKDGRGFTVLYRWRVVERTLAWMGRCRSLSKDRERLCGNSRVRGEASRTTGPGVMPNARRLPVPAQAGGEGVNPMKIGSLMKSVTYDSNSEKLDFPDACFLSIRLDQ